MNKLAQLRNVAGTMAAAAMLSGCAAYGNGVIWPYPDHYPGNPYGIPSGHMPPPGECRIWFPDRPAGQQPPPGDCHDLKWRVPPGGVLVHG